MAGSALLLGVLAACARLASSQAAAPVRTPVMSQPVSGTIAQPLAAVPQAPGAGPPALGMSILINTASPAPTPGSAAAGAPGGIAGNVAGARGLGVRKSPWRIAELDTTFDGSRPAPAAEPVASDPDAALGLWSALERQALASAGVAVEGRPAQWRADTARALRDDPALDLSAALAAGFARAHGTTEEQARSAEALLSSDFTFEALDAAPLSAAWHEGKLWLASNQGIHTAEAGRLEWHRHGQTTWLATIRGRLYAGARDGLWVRAGDTWDAVISAVLPESKRTPPLDQAHFVGEAGGRLWASMDTGLYSMDPDARPSKPGTVRRAWRAVLKRVSGASKEQPSNWRKEIDSVQPFRAVVEHEGRIYAAGRNGVWLKTGNGWTIVIPGPHNSLALASFEGALYASLPERNTMGRLKVRRGDTWSVEDIPTVGPVSQLLVLDDTLLAVAPDGVFARRDAGWVRVVPKQAKVLIQLLRGDRGDLLVGSGFLMRASPGPQDVPEDWRNRIENDLTDELRRQHGGAKPRPRSIDDDLDDGFGRSLLGD